MSVKNEQDNTNFVYSTKLKSATMSVRHNVQVYLRIDRNVCAVHEEITSIRLYTPGYERVCTTWL